MTRKIVLVGLVALLVGTYATAVGAGPQPVGNLEVGEAVFWDGSPLAPGEELNYSLDLAPGGHRLRVAIAVPDRIDEFTLTVRSPEGESSEASTTYSFNAEVFVEKPSGGRWDISVISENPEPTLFRMRAKLEAEPKAGPTVPLVPNLRPVAPFQFTFIAPITGPNFLLGDYDNQPLDVAGHHPFSCSFDEMEDDAARCLRFTAGIENAGDGPLDLRFRPLPDAAAPVMHQLIHYSNGTTKSREAGTFEFHPTHYHYHYADIWSFKLLRVVDMSKGRLEDVGRGKKSGFCPGDQHFADWYRFNQDPIYTHYGNCGMEDQIFYTAPDTEQGVLALSTGWGDIYRWYRPGNYVEFAGLDDGLYVLQVLVDTHEWVLETSERDNVAYALVKITGEEIKLLERGRGTSPWDRNKAEIRDWWKS